MRIVSGVMSFCLLMLLYGCNDAYTGNYNSFIIDTTDGVPASVETSPSQETTTVPSDPTETTTSSTETKMCIRDSPYWAVQMVQNRLSEAGILKSQEGRIHPINTFYFLLLYQIIFIFQVL